MNTAVVHRFTQAHAPRFEALESPAKRSFEVVVLRTVLVATPVAAAAIAWLLASGSSRLAEPELALLLRGMAVLKALLAAAVFGLVWWRLGQPVGTRAAVTYIGCVSALCASSVLIWQLAFIPAAAVLFHAAGLVALVLAMREGRQAPRFGRQAPDPSS